MADETLPEGTDTIISDTGMEEGGVTGGNDSAAAGGGNSGGGGFREAFRTGSDKLRTTANDKAMGLVGQGLERSKDALANVSSLIGDTAASLDERLGTQYGDYARSAAGAIERAANTLAAKDPDELVEDARAFVRKSPGVALAGAAILGFALVRVVKAGLDDSGAKRSGKRD